MSLFSRTDKSFIGQWWWTVDRGLLVAVLSIVVFGIVLVAAASPPVAERIGVDQYHFIKRHLILLVPAMGLLIGMSMLTLQQVWRTALVVLSAGILGLIFVLLFGVEIKGAQRWIHLPGFSLQPSEFVKPAFIVVAAWMIAKQKKDQSFPGMKAAFGVYGVVFALLILQPDLGMTVVVSACFAAVIFLAGLPMRWIAFLGAAAIGLAALAYLSFGHVQSRVDRFLDPDSGDTYQIERSLDAFQHGGLFGTGPGQGTVKLSIPDAHADFIFSVAGEELGLVFVAVLIALFAYVLVHGFNRIMDSDDMFVVLATGGLLTLFGFQALIHMGSALNLLPTKGMTLPFISYGGSSLLAMGMGMGMVLALTRRQKTSGIARGGLSIRPIGGGV